MKKNVIAAIVLAAVLVSGVGAALAAAGSADDPFVDLNYLTDVYQVETQQALLQQVSAAAADMEQSALDRLDTMASAWLALAGQEESTDSYLRLTLSREDRLILPTGASILFEAGQGELTFITGTLVDVTSGGTVTAGGALSPGHCYVAAERTACSFTAATDAVILSVLGSYCLERAGVVCSPFTDLFGTEWYYPYACAAYDLGLIQGTNAATPMFSANVNMSRAMLAAVLQRLSGSQETAPDAGFTDVVSGSWYVDSVNWAANAGIVLGIGNGAFLPEADVTREQMALMLYRYARDYLGMSVSANGDLSAFPDQAQTSSWAVEALSWAVGSGIIIGGDGKLSPGATATRAEVATMLQRFVDYIA